MSKWDEPVTTDELIVLVFALAIFCMAAVPMAFVFAAIGGIVGLGGTQNMWTICVSFGIVILIGWATMIYVSSRMHRQ